MQKNAVEYLEQAVLRYPDRTAFAADGEALTFAQINQLALKMGARLAGAVPVGRVVAVLGERSVYTPALFLAALYAGCWVAPLGPELPPYRLRNILETLEPGAILTDGRCDALLSELNFSGPVFRLADTMDDPDPADLLGYRRLAITDNDPCLILFTSGSSGKPKGVVIPHRAVIDAVDVYADVFSIGPEDILGGQSPLDYVAAIRDIFLPLATGCQTVLIPRRLFATPGTLFEFLNQNKITTLFWAAPALSLCAELDAFSAVRPETVKKVIFTGSVLPNRHLRIWLENLPGAYFANHYGPTEITGSCIYCEVKGLDDPLLDRASLPIGHPFPNVKITLLDEQGRETPDEALGEICVSGSRLALGYFNEPQLNEAAFVRRVRDGLPETIYKTGDLGRRDAQGVYTFHGRRDSQIKHMGHRIELSEIETLGAAHPGVRRCVCLYGGPTTGQIRLFYEGEASAKELSLFLRARLPAHMIPRKFQRMDALPATPGGKPDRAALARLIDG